MTRDDVIQALRAADQRAERVRALAAQHPDAPLPTGEWNVHDALSHVAACANMLPFAQRLLERARQAQAGAAPAPPLNLDEVNAGQVRERAANSVDQLVDETLAGHRAAMEQVLDLDEAMLEQTVPVTFPPGELNFIDLLGRVGPGHESNHMDEIEAALRNA